MEWKKAHFIGIGGVGMSGVALLLRDAGVEISGSDEAVYPPVSTLLTQEGILYQTPYAATNIPADVDLIVIGKNAKLVPESNPEVAAALASGKTTLSFPDVLAQLSAGKETIVVAGSYGKSTSTALMSHCLESAGMDPSFFIGAVPLSPRKSAHQGSGPLFVIEGDEYPSSNTDPKSKFLHYAPRHLLLTPLAHDHLNIFPTKETYLRPFEELLQLTPPEGVVVACVSGPLSHEFLANIKRPVVTYGVHEGDFHATGIVWGEETSFSILHHGTTVLKARTTQLGEHNIENIVGVVALLLSCNLLTATQLQAGVASFKGIKRRLDRQSEKTTIPIFEGFGSSYEKARAALQAMKQHFPTRRLLVVFEPHTFSWRNRDALPWYDGVFAEASKVFVYEPASQGAATHKQLTQEEIVERIQKGGVDAVAITDPAEALEMLEKELQPNDCILLSTSGNLGGLIESIPRMAEQKFPA